MATRQDRKKAAAKRAQAGVNHDEIIGALQAEHAGYVKRGLDDRAKAVQAEIGKHKRAAGGSSGSGSSGSAKAAGATSGAGPSGADKASGTTGSAKSPSKDESGAGTSPGDGKVATSAGSGAKDS